MTNTAIAPLPGWQTLAGAARAAGYSRCRLYQMLARGDFRAAELCRVGRTTLLSDATVYRLRARRAAWTPPVRQRR